MKGFIEVNNSSKEIISLNNINRIHPYLDGVYKTKIYTNSEIIIVTESYEKIKQLIKEAQL